MEILLYKNVYNLNTEYVNDMYVMKKMHYNLRDN